MCSLLHKYYAPQMMLLTTKFFCWNSNGCFASFSTLHLYTYHDQKSVFYLSLSIAAILYTCCEGQVGNLEPGCCAVCLKKRTWRNLVWIYLAKQAGGV